MLICSVITIYVFLFLNNIFNNAIIFNWCLHKYIHIILLFIIYCYIAIINSINFIITTTFFIINIIKC